LKKVIILLISVLLILTTFSACSSEKKSEEELRAEIKAEIEIENQLKEEQATKAEDLSSMDFDLLYYMDQDIDFLTMKGMGLPSEDEAYYVGTYGDGFEIRFYLAEDNYTINRITLISELDKVEKNKYNETHSFMGLYLGMPMEAAKEYMQKESPDYLGELEVKYYDNAGDGIIHQIDVYSKKELEKRIEREDFYFKFFDMNINYNNAAHLGNGSGAQETLEVDNENRTYTYNITFGPDIYQKVYKYNEKNSIVSMEIKTNQDEFMAVVPSMFGIQLGGEKEKIPQMVHAANKTIHNSNTAKITDSMYDVEEYTIIDNPSQVVYTAEVYIDQMNKKVKKIKGYFKPKILVSQNHLLNLIGEKLDGSPEFIEGTGTEKWAVDFEAYSDNIVQSVAIANTEESVFVNTVPSLCGLQLNMFETAVRNTLLNNGYEIVNENRYQPFDDQSLETIRYKVINSETKKESNIYITSKYIGDISAAIVVRIGIGKNL